MHAVGTIGRETSGDLAASVRRSVVDEQQLPMRVRLREHAFGGLAQERIRRSMELFAREVMPRFR